MKKGCTHSPHPPPPPTVQGRRHQFEGGGGWVNALEGSGSLNRKTLKFEKRGGVWPPSPTSYGGTAPATTIIPIMATDKNNLITQMRRPIIG